MELDELPPTKARRLASLVQAVGVRSPEQPDARQVLDVVASVDGGAGGDLTQLQRSILARIVRDADPLDLRVFLGSDARTGRFLAAAVRAAPWLARSAFVAAAVLEFHPQDIFAIEKGRDP